MPNEQTNSRKSIFGSWFALSELDLGLEQAGMETVWQVEYDEWCRDRLAENFPHTEKFNDVREVGKHNLKPVDLICGGFPCQDLSVAKKDAKGLDGERSGLWSEYVRIIRELRPRYALIENVAKLSFSGLERVLSDLAESGYDAEWQTLRAEALGLPHPRPRLFIIAYAKSRRLLSAQVFCPTAYQRSVQERQRIRPEDVHFIESLKRSFVQIPEHLRMDDGRTYELSEIERAVKGYGNGVAVPVGKWLGQQILRFDKEINGEF